VISPLSTQGRLQLDESVSQVGSGYEGKGTLPTTRTRYPGTSPRIFDTPSQTGRLSSSRCLWGQGI